MAAETVSNLIFTGPLAWTVDAACVSQTDLFFAPAGERPETRVLREARARAICRNCEVVDPCRDWARSMREYGFWGGESEEERAAAGYRVDMPVGRVARYPKGDGQPVKPARVPRRLVPLAPLRAGIPVTRAFARRRAPSLRFGAAS